MKEAFLGIDVSKGYADFFLIDKKKKILEPNFQLDDTAKGHSKLIEVLKTLKQKHQITMIYSAVESTGGYENNWLNLLKGKGPEINLQVARVNPYGVKQDSKAGMIRTETDGESARCVAEYLVNHPEKVTYNDPGYDLFDSLRRLFKHIRTIVKQKAQLQAKLEKHLYLVFPELLSYCREEMPMWILLLLQQFPTLKEVRKASPESLQQIPGVSERKAQIIKEKAEKSVASVNDHIIARLVTSTVSEIILKIGTIKELKKILEKEAGNNDLVALLTTFIGIAEYSAVGLLVAIEDINRFSSSKKVCSFFGLHPVFKQSGDGVFKMRMSKQGSSEVRSILYMVATAALISNPHIKLIYDKHRASGMCHNKAMGVIMHKILRIVYGMLKNNSPYDPEYDMKMQVRSIEKQKVNIKTEKKHRYESPNEDAPISKRQVNKRKGQVDAPSLITKTYTASS